MLKINSTLLYYTILLDHILLHRILLYQILLYHILLHHITICHTLILWLFGALYLREDWRLSEVHFTAARSPDPEGRGTQYWRFLDSETLPQGSKLPKYRVSRVSIQESYFWLWVDAFYLGTWTLGVIPESMI